MSGFSKVSTLSSFALLNGNKYWFITWPTYSTWDLRDDTFRATGPSVMLWSVSWSKIFCNLWLLWYLSKWCISAIITEASKYTSRIWCTSSGKLKAVLTLWSPYLKYSKFAECGLLQTHDTLFNLYITLWVMKDESFWSCSTIEACDWHPLVRSSTAKEFKVSSSVFF